MNKAPGRKAAKLARLNRRITRLSAELETLHFMQDRLERELKEIDAGKCPAPAQPRMEV
jgi:hypothetical protein